MSMSPRKSVRGRESSSVLSQLNPVMFSVAFSHQNLRNFPISSIVFCIYVSDVCLVLISCFIGVLSALAAPVVSVRHLACHLSFFVCCLDTFNLDVSLLACSCPCQVFHLPVPVLWLQASTYLCDPRVPITSHPNVLRSALSILCRAPHSFSSSSSFLSACPVKSRCRYRVVPEHGVHVHTPDVVLLKIVP